MSKAFVFPGQGAQIVGMGKALATEYSAAKAVFDEVDDALNEKLSDLIWDGTIEDLTLTHNAQPALMAASLAAVKALESEGVSIGSAGFVAGHSLGEYSALAAAGALSISDAARLLRTRGNAMQAAVPVGVGAMAAILGLDMEGARKVATRAADDMGQVCEAANDNDPAQVVISGHADAVKHAIALAQEAGARRAVMLPVSAPFHCSLMQPAADEMAEALSHVTINEPKVPLVANVLAHSCDQPPTIRSLLVDQVTGSVRWRESVIWMNDNGVDEYWELGAGKALCGMIRRIDKSKKLLAVTSPDEVRVAAQSIADAA